MATRYYYIGRAIIFIMIVAILFIEIKRELIWDLKWDFHGKEQWNTQKLYIFDGWHSMLGTTLWPSG